MKPRMTYVYLLVYFAALHLIPFVNMLPYGERIPVFLVIDSIAIYSFALTLVYLHGGLGGGERRLSFVDTMVALYILVSLCSFFLYFQGNHPAPPYTYLYGVHHLLVPIGLYFSVKLIGTSLQKSLLTYVCALNVAMVAVSLLLYFVRPDFYTSFLVGHYARVDLSTYAVYSRMSGYLGSITLGMVSAVTIVLLTAIRMRPARQALLIGLMVAGVALSQQRGAFIGALLGLAYFVFADRAHTMRRLAVFGLIGAIAVGGAIWYEGLYPGSLAYWQHRIVSISEALAERSGSYSRGWSYLLDNPAGLGLGATSSAAGYAALNLRGDVTDANYARILADLGMVGLAVFLLAVFGSIRSALRKPSPLLWVTLVVIYCTVAIGSNVFDTYYTSHLFWVILGIIDTLSEERPVSGGSTLPEVVSNPASLQPI